MHIHDYYFTSSSPKCSGSDFTYAYILRTYIRTHVYRFFWSCRIFSYEESHSTHFAVPASLKICFPKYICVCTHTLSQIILTSCKHAVPCPWKGLVSVFSLLILPLNGNRPNRIDSRRQIKHIVGVYPPKYTLLTPAWLTGRSIKFTTWSWNRTSGWNRDPICTHS